MGSSIFVVLDRDLPELDVFMKGKALAKAESRINRLCRRLDVRDLWSFYSDEDGGAAGDAYLDDDDDDDGGGPWDADDDDGDSDPGDDGDDVDDDYDDLDDEEEDSEEQWFSPAEGLETVMTLVEHIEQSDGAGLRDADGVLEDLRAMERLLELAEVEGAQWHLGVDF